MSWPTFDGEYKPRLRATVNHNVADYMERKVEEARQLNNADEAERLLDAACDQCVKEVQSQVEEIKKEVKSRRGNGNEANFATFAAGVAAGIIQTQGFIRQIFDRIHSLVRTVINWIRRGAQWVWSTVTDTFSAIRNFFS